MCQAVVGTSAVMDTLDMFNNRQNRINFMTLSRMIVMAWQGIGNESVQLHNNNCAQIVHSGHLQMSDNTAQFSSRINSSRY